jgi:hypothetical protein
MKRLALSTLLGFAMVAAAAAQTGTGSTSPSSTTPDQSTSPSTSATGTTQDQTATASTTNKKADKEAKLTGCVEKQGSNYALVDKKHPNGVQLLTSEDLSAHVGHKVQVKGTWEAASMSSASSTSPSGSTSASSTSPSSSSSSNAPMSESTPSTSSSSSTSGAGSSSNASSLPQSDQSASGQALRVTEVKMKSDKCDMTSGNNNPSKY